MITLRGMNNSTCMGVLPFDPALGYVGSFDSIIRPLVETHVGLVYVDARGFYEPQIPKIEAIFGMVRAASLVIVDISVKNPNVFLELGYALACDKRLVIICERKAWESKEDWNRLPPFDLQGRELLIYKDAVDLKVQLGGFIANALNRSQRITLSWTATGGFSDIRSSTEFDLVRNETVWTDRAVQFPFSVAFRVKLKEIPENPDVRLEIKPSSQEYPRISCIFPWETSEIDSTKAECHIDYLTSKVEKTEVRLRQASVCKKAELTEKASWSVFLVFRHPNLVFESSLFESQKERLVVSMIELLQKGFPLQNGLQLGFSAGQPTSISIEALQEISSF